MSVLDNFKLDGKVIIITGGAGFLGTHYVEAVREAGGIPIIADINTKTDIKKHHYAVDITDKALVKTFVNDVQTRFGHIDGLINNAAIDPKFDPVHLQEHSSLFEEYSLDEWNESLSVNATGMFLCCQAVGSVMVSQNYGSIVNISSIYGLLGPDQRLYEKSNSKSYKPVAYSVGKSSVLGLTRYLATYWSGKNIRVNTLTLGGVFNGHDKEFVKRYSEKNPLCRMARADEYNAAIVFLLSEASSYMTGSNLIIDGGWTAW